MTFSGRGQLGPPAVVLLLAGVFAAAVGAVVLAPEGEPVATWWPAAGIAVCTVGLARRSWWWWLVPAVAVAVALANLAGGRPPDLAAWYGAAGAAEALVAAWVLRHGRDRLPGLGSLDDFVRLLWAAALGALTNALLAGVGVVLLEGGSFTLASWLALSSHTAATLVIVPIAMTLHHPAPARFRRELPVQAAALAVVTVVVFAPDQTLSLDFVPLPFLIWGALRFDVRTVSWELLAFAAATTYLSLEGYGPFGFDHERGELSATSQGAVVQGYVFAAALMSLPLPITIWQRRRLLERVTSSERLFRRNFTESVVGMLLLRSGDRPFEIVDLNDSAARILGGTHRSVGRGLGEVLDTPEPLELVAARMLAGNLDGWKGQSGLRDRPAARVNVAISLVTTDPEPVFAAQLQDVTTEYDARRRLEAAEKLTNAALDTTAAMILVTDLDGVVVRVNGATTALTGFGEDELLGASIWDVAFAPAGSTGYPAGLPEDASAQASRETDVTTKAGGTLRVLWNTSYVRDERDQPTHVVLTGTDLTAERTAAGINEHLFRAAITTALIGIDPRGLITVFNAGAVRLLGHDAQDIVGEPFTGLLDPDERTARLGAGRPEDAFAALVAQIGPDGDSTPRDWTWVGSNGARHTVSMTLSVARDAFASRVGYLCVGRDVTEARASQEMLIAALEKERTAVDRLRELDEAKNVFVSTVSHELRTPVTSIVGYTEMLQDGSAVAPLPGQEPLLESIARNGQRLILLCDDLLTLGGLDSGDTDWERQALDVATLLPGVEDTIRSFARGRDLTLTFVDAGSALVLGDRLRLERVLVNLLSNAVKFTEDGGHVECRVEARDGEAWLTVCDTGIGIPEAEQSRLFQRFFRSSTAQRRAIQGSGLGLSIVAEIVAAHGGRIDVRSAHLEGTTFTVRLPLARG